MKGEEIEVFYIAGDLCPTAINVDHFIGGDAESLLGEELCALIKNSTGLIFNLETALSDIPTPIVKSGPCLIAAEESVNALAAMKPICACTANNHIADSGKGGLMRTWAALDGAEIPHCGSGSGIEDASDAHFFEMAGKTYAVYACAEHEFTIATLNKPGANPFNPVVTCRQISFLAQQVDEVIVLYHGMKERYQYPSPLVRDNCRLMVEAGASLVCCQHSHCIGCMEEWHGSTIVYGQGNFHFITDGADEMWLTGLLVSVDANGSIGFLPIRGEGQGIKLLNGVEAGKVLADFHRRSSEIAAPGFVEASWGRFCSEIADQYAIQLLDAIEPKFLAFFVRVLQKLRLVRPKLATGEKSAGFLNMLQCEAHNEVLQTYLKRRLDDPVR